MLCAWQRSSKYQSYSFRGWLDLGLKPWSTKLGASMFYFLPRKVNEWILVCPWPSLWIFNITWYHLRFYWDPGSLKFSPTFSIITTFYLCEVCFRVEYDNVVLHHPPIFRLPFEKNCEDIQIHSCYTYGQRKIYVFLKKNPMIAKK